VLPPLAQVALEEGETVTHNLDAELRGRPLEAFTVHDNGFVVSVATRRGVAEHRPRGVMTGGGGRTWPRSARCGYLEGSCLHYGRHP
jgi:NADH dehydrogenase FAD-containing subunit